MPVFRMGERASRPEFLHFFRRWRYVHLGRKIRDLIRRQCA
jgi:hypothetical protein